MGPTSKREQGRSLRRLTTILVLALLAAVLLAGTALAAAKPGKPMAKTPKGTISTTKPTFKWSKAARATRYEVRVYKGSKLLVKKAGIARRSWKCSKALPKNVSLTWKVRARNAAGNGAWSKRRTFKVRALSTAKAITAFSFSSPAATGSINESAHTIALSVPYGTNVSALVATFTTTGASVAVAGTPQVSGVTANNFSSPLTYRVTAANASTQAYAVTVTIASNPVVDSLVPTSGPLGSTVTFNGHGFGNDPAKVVATVASLGVEVVSVTDTSIVVKLPDTIGWEWDGKRMGPSWVEVNGVDNRQRPMFTITPLPPSPPTFYSNCINYYASSDDDWGTVGERVYIVGNGFDEVASHNLIRFGTVVAAAYSTVWHSTENDTGAIWVTVPKGATSGVFSARRSDGQNWWETGAYFEVRPRIDPVITAGLQAGGAFNPRPWGMGLPVNWYQMPLESWLIKGSGFMSFGDRAVTGRGWFELTVTTSAGTYEVPMQAVDDTTAVIDHRQPYSESECLDPALFTGIKPGASMTLRAHGEVYDSFHAVGVPPLTRQSAPITITYGSRVTYGELNDVDLPFATQTIKMSKGDILDLRCYWETVLNLTGPGIWSGSLPFSYDQSGHHQPGLRAKMFRLSTAGTYKITDSGSGNVLTVNVLEGGTWGTDSSAHAAVGSGTLDAEGMTMAAGGARLVVPPHALPPVTESDPAATSYTISLKHVPSTVVCWDPANSDFGHQFGLSITPEPKRLLKPLTITLPYDPAGRVTPPYFGAFDGGSQLYYDLGGTLDAGQHTLKLTLPAGAYPAGGSGVAPRNAATPRDAGTLGLGAGTLPPVSLNTMVATIGPVSDTATRLTTIDSDRLIRIDYVSDTTDPSYVDYSYATYVMQIAQQTYDNLTSSSHDWRAPGDWITIYIRDHGSPDEIKGFTRGCWGVPYITMNSNVPVGSGLATAVAHEMGHVFERLYVRNFSIKWVDEGIAEWVAFDTLGANADLSNSFSAGADFAVVGIPSGFYLGFDPEQVYASGAFFIWLANTYGEDVPSEIYRHLETYPADIYDTYATLNFATGYAIDDLTKEFGPSYWTQDYAPLVGLNLDVEWATTHREFNTPGALVINDNRPAYSSQRFTIAAGGTSAPKGLETVVRAETTGAGWEVHIYGDANTANSFPGTLTKIATLTSATPKKAIGAWSDPAAGGYKCYRYVVVNHGDAALPLTITTVGVKIDSLSPSGGWFGGGYSVRVDGTGFGTQQGLGRVTIGGFPMTPTAWSDTAITFTMPNMGTTTQTMNVQVTTDEGAKSTVKPFSLHN